LAGLSFTQERRQRTKGDESRQPQKLPPSQWAVLWETAQIARMLAVLS
jgi:hypothetical protein